MCVPLLDCSGPLGRGRGDRSPPRTPCWATVRCGLRGRCAVERFFNRVKQGRAPATCYDQHAATSRGAVLLAALLPGLAAFPTTPTNASRETAATPSSHRLPMTPRTKSSRTSSAGSAQSSHHSAWATVQRESPTSARKHRRAARPVTRETRSRGPDPLRCRRGRQGEPRRCRGVSVHGVVLEQRGKAAARAVFEDQTRVQAHLVAKARSSSTTINESAPRSVAGAAR